jgi:hypothetical protein
LDDLFSTLEAEGARYAVLRGNAEVLRSGQELDLLVPPAALRTVLKAIFALAVRDTSIRIAYWRELPFHAATVILVWRGNEGAMEHYFFDIRCGIHKRGHLLLDGRDLGQDTTIWDPRFRFRRLSDELECGLLLVRNALDQREPKSRHEWILRHRWTEAVPVVVRQLGFEYDVASRRATVPAGSVHRTRGQWKRLCYTLRGVYGRARCRSGGVNIVFYGPDGVGKSTQAELVADFFRGIGVGARRVEVYHAFKRVDDAPRRTTGDTGEPKSHSALRHKAYKRARGLPARVLLLTGSFVKRLLIHRFRLVRKVKRGAILLHDRYFLDVFLKFFKLHGARLRRLEGVLGSMCPNDDMVFILRADPHVVSSRTGELTAPEVADTYELLDACLAHGHASNPPVDIDANRDVEQVLQEVLDHALRSQTEDCLKSERLLDVSTV